MYNRKIKLIRALIGNEKISSDELADKLNISQRTLRSEIRDINDILKKENVSIHSFNLGGYYIKPEEKNIISKYLENMIIESKQIILPETPYERFLFGFTWLFFQKNPVSIQKAADSLYVSRTSMLQTKKQIQDTLELYPDVFLSSGNNGMFIDGCEKTKRHVLADTINYWTYGSILMERVITFLFGAEKYRDYISIYRVLPEILLKNGYRLIDKATEGFALDIFISIVRNEQGFKLENNHIYYKNSCIDMISDFIKSKGYILPDCEKEYILSCLKAKRILYNSAIHNNKDNEYVYLVNEFLSMIDENYHTSYQDNQELIDKLEIHITKMIIRLREGYFEINSILNDILNLYKTEIDMAKKINPILEKKYGLTANIHEISYIALYLKAYSINTIKAIILCDIGESIADNMQRQIEDYCGRKIQILNKMSLTEYRLNPISVDLLISGSRIYDVNLPQNTKIIYVDYILNEENLKNIQKFLINN